MDVGGRGERGVKAVVRDSCPNIRVSVALSSSVGPAADRCQAAPPHTARVASCEKDKCFC